jgi:ankyrin repeat protein
MINNNCFTNLNNFYVSINTSFVREANCLRAFVWRAVEHQDITELQRLWSYAKQRYNESENPFPKMLNGHPAWGWTWNALKNVSDPIMVKLLVEYGADPDLPENDRHTGSDTLMRHIARDVDIHMADPLLSYGKSDKELELQSALLDAVKNKNAIRLNELWAVARSWLEKPATLIQNIFTVIDHETLAWALRKAADPFLTKVLIACGANPDAQDDDGNTPMHHAVCDGDMEKVTLLLACNASPNIPNNIGYTPVYFAVSMNNHKLVTQLLKGGANVALQDKKGHTVLHYAVRYADVSVLNLLCNQGADPDVQDDKGCTVTHRAVACADIAVLGLLIYRGANPNLQDNEGRTVMHHAVRLNNGAAVELLLTQRGVKVKDQTIELFKDVTRHIDLHKKDKEGRTAMYYAELNGYTRIANLLQQYGAEPGTKDSPSVDICFFEGQGGGYTAMERITNYYAGKIAGLDGGIKSLPDLSFITEGMESFDK